MSPLPATVLVATKDRPDSLARCLASLVCLADGPTEILVVDNGPDAATRAVVERLAGVHVELRYLYERRAGASRARNLGLGMASQPFVAVTDDDVVVDRHWLGELLGGFGRGDDVGAVTGLVLPGRLDVEAEALFEAWGGFNKGYEAKVFGAEPPEGAGPLYPFSPGIYGSGNNVAFRTEVLRDLGGYDLALGPGTPARAGEELDLFLSLITSGRRIAYEPSALVWHHHRATEAELEAQLYDYGIGLSALMTKWALRSPGDAVALLGRLPGGLRALTQRAGPAEATGSDRPALPGRLRRAEWRGLARGPLALLEGRRAARPPRRRVLAAPASRAEQP